MCYVPHRSSDLWFPCGMDVRKGWMADRLIKLLKTIFFYEIGLLENWPKHSLSNVPKKHWRNIWNQRFKFLYNVQKMKTTKGENLWWTSRGLSRLCINLFVLLLMHKYTFILLYYGICTSSKWPQTDTV